MKGALTEVRQTLAGGGIVVLQIDQNVHNPPRFFVPFLGRLATVTQSLGLLAVRYRPAVIPVVSIPLPRGRYRIVYGPRLELPTEGSAGERAWEITARATGIIEGWIRERPDSWLWQHNRWKDQPRGAVELEAVARLRAGGHLDEAEST
jgi:KDO2-lipid IV(A) lauroyltransferase